MRNCLLTVNVILTGEPWVAKKVEDRIYLCIITPNQPKYSLCRFVWNSFTFDRSLRFMRTAPSSGQRYNLIWWTSLFYFLIKRVYGSPEEGHCTPTCHHRFIKWLCTIQMQNKIRNTEMEYIARANRCVDSSFLADGIRQTDWNIGVLLCICCLFVFLFAHPGSLFYTSTLFSLHDGCCCWVSEEFFFFLSKRTKEVYDFIWLGNIDLYICI